MQQSLNPNQQLCDVNYGGPTIVPENEHVLIPRDQDVRSGDFRERKQIVIAGVTAHGLLVDRLVKGSSTEQVGHGHRVVRVNQPLEVRTGHHIREFIDQVR